jgi:hypothetical protein
LVAHTPYLTDLIVYKAQVQRPTFNKDSFLFTVYRLPFSEPKSPAPLIMDPKATGVSEPYVVESKEGDAKLTPEKRHSITGDIFVTDHGAETELRRILSTRHLTMIALGSSIGMGLWLGSGTSLVDGGPAGKNSLCMRHRNCLTCAKGIFLGYTLSGFMIWSVAHSIGEMAVM